tara:strand:+ start:144 stop:410 length:267 start_codon:yes stop_codon:yes gene_type:complete
MPTYDFLNTKTNAVEEHFVSMSELDKFQEDNPHLQKQISAPSGIQFENNMQISSKNLPSWFKDKMQRVAESPGVKHTKAGKNLENYYK